MSDIKNSQQEESIDFKKISQDLLKHKKLYYKVLPIVFVLTTLIALSIPNYYNCTVKLSPELSGNKGTSSLASLASSFGVNFGTGLGNSTEALFPTLYPDLMNSVDFKTDLFKVKVFRESDNQEFSYYDYLANEQKYPWWTTGFKALKGFFDSKKDESTKIDPFRLSKDQTEIVKEIDKKVVCNVDKKTMVITISVTDQDPLICATLADSVKMRLQQFITDYRTSKARVDLEYNKKLYVKAKARYEEARDRYAAFSDSHRDVSSQRAQTMEADLQSEMQMQQSILQQVVGQLEQAEMKVQEQTPAFTTLQSATVPVLKAGPKRAQMCLIFLFLAFLGTTVWILFKEDDLKMLIALFD